MLHRLRHVVRLLRVDEPRATRGDGAEAAAARADVSQDHEGGRAIAPAFVDVGAAGFLADGVQLQPFDHAAHHAIAGPGIETHFEPGGLRAGLPECRSIGHQEASRTGGRASPSGGRAPAAQSRLPGIISLPKTMANSPTSTAATSSRGTARPRRRSMEVTVRVL